jgi:tRNA (guanine26-N2/guanine27-N2)-dimethyltransferase
LIVREGNVSIETISSFEKGPGKASPGFYNRTMEVSRDMTVAILRTLKPGIALDSMAGTGIRGLRIAKETEWKVVLNDRDPRNSDIQAKNAKLNSIDVDILNSDYFCAVSSRKWDYIDVDPFGSPSGLIDAAIMNLKNGGIIGVTMTDTANLEGRSINKGARIYGSRSLKGIFSREISTRIFVKYVMERGASVGRAGEPLLAVRDSHYIRTFIRFKKGSKVASDSMKDIKNVEVEGENVGPIYTGRLYMPDIITRMEGFQFSERSRRLFENFKNEDLMFLFYTNSTGTSEVRKHRIVEELIRRGYRAGYTNFSEKGIKTDAGRQEYNNILMSL